MALRNNMVATLAALALLALTPNSTPAFAADPTCTVTITTSGAQVDGTNNNEVICINADNVTVNALGGNDTIVDNGNNNTIFMGDGNDVFTPGSGSGATVDGGAGDDVVTGTPGPDEITGDDGNDTLIGGGGDDTILGGTGNDNLEGDAGADQIFGEAGVDTITGNAGNDILAGGAGLDALDGGTGLNMCDFSAGESQTQTCTYDDAAPTISASTITASAWDSTSSDIPAMVNATFADQSGVSQIDLLCTTLSNGITYRAIDATGLNGVWSNHLRVGSIANSDQNPGPLTKSLNLSATLAAGAFPGAYNCDFTLTDPMGNSQTYAHNLGFTITRDAGLTFDDRAPIPSNVSFSNSSVDTGPAAAHITLNFTLSDATGIDWGYFTCALAGSNGDTRGVELTFNAQMVYDYKTGNRTSLISGDSKVANYQIDLTIAQHLQAGNYPCSVISWDVLSHRETFENLATLVVSNSTGDSDTTPPTVVSSSVSNPNVEVGAQAATATLNLSLADPSGLGWSYLNCEANLGGTLRRLLYSGIDPTRVYDYTKGYLNATITGTPTNPTFQIPIAIAAGQYPGKYLCNLYASDTLNNRVYISNVGEINVFRTPAGQPTAPNQLAFTPTDPRNGTLSWAAPDSLGSPALTAYVSQYSTDGTTWQALPGGVSKTASLPVANLEPDRDYWFRVRGDNGSTSGQDTAFMNLPWSNIKVHTPVATVPSSPTNLKFDKITSSSASASWTAPASNGGSAITDFSVETSRDGGTTWVTVPKNAASTSTTLNITGLAAGTNYQVRVSAVNGVGNSDPLVGSVKTLATVPATVTNLGFTNLKSTSLSLTWSLPATNGGSAISDYKVMVSSSGTAFTAIQHPASKLLAFAVTNLNAGTKYWFKVAAVNSVGASVFTDTVSLVTLGNAPAAPTSLSVTNVGSQVKLAWKAAVVSGGSPVRDYKIEYSKDGGKTWTIAVKAVSTSTSFTTTNLKSATTYWLRVTAINDVGSSPASASLKVVTK